MSIKKLDIRFYSELSADPVDWSLFNIGDKMRCEIDFEVASYVVGSTDTPFTFNATDGYIGTGWVKFPTPAFAGWNIGDMLYYYHQPTSTVGTFNIIDKLSDSEIRIDVVLSGVGDNWVVGPVVLSLAKDTTALEYMYNLIENSESVNFISKVDGSTQLLKNYSIDASNTTPLPMIFMGELPYQIGDATIQGIEIGIPVEGESEFEYYSNRFTIKHNFIVTPFTLASQLSDLISGIEPSYFTTSKCLKYVCNLKALYIATDPTKFQTVTINDTEGNSGWLGENFNTGLTNYYVENVEFRQYPSFLVIPSLEITNSLQFFSFDIRNTVDSPFVDGDTKVNLNFNKCPYDESEYQANGRDMKTNFVFDRLVGFADSTPATINGDNYATSLRVFKDVQIIYVDSTTVRVQGFVDFQSLSQSIIEESEVPTYLISVAIQDSTLDTDVADKVRLVVSVDDYYIATSDPTMIITDGYFLRHTESDPDTEGNASINVFPEDEVVNYNRFYIDKNGREDDEILLKSIQFKVKAKNTSTLAEFTLDTLAPLDLTSLELDSSGLQYVDFSMNRPFHIPVAEIRKKIVFKRRGDLDAANKYYYEVYFPFLVRWEYFIALAGVNPAFFDSSEPNNGKNHFWDRYSNLGDWKLFYEMRIIATKNGVLQSYTTENQFDSSNWGDNNRWILESIKAYDPDSGLELYDAITDKKYIYGYKLTRIEALFKYSPPYPLDIDNYVVNMGIESYEGTGVAERTRMSSKWPSDSDTWFKSLDASDKTILTLVSGHTVKAECYVDFTKIPDKPIFKIAARIYEVIAPETGKRMEDGTFKKMESGVQKLMD